MLTLRVERQPSTERDQVDAGLDVPALGRAIEARAERLRGILGEVGNVEVLAGHGAFSGYRFAPRAYRLAPTSRLDKPLPQRAFESRY